MKISKNVVCATSTDLDQPAHSRSLIRAFASLTVKQTEQYLEISKLNRRLHRLVQVYLCQNATLLEISCRGSYYCSYYLQVCIYFITINGFLLTKSLGLLLKRSVIVAYFYAHF